MVAVLLALLVGAGAGYAVAASGDSGTEPVETFADAQPLPAADPSFPVIEYDVLPDPTTPPLATNVALVTTRLKDADTTISTPVPQGWREVDLVGPAWNYSVPTNPTNTYLLRIGILTGTRTSTSVQVAARIEALRSTERDGYIEDFRIERQTDTEFVGSYIDAGYRRVVIETFLPQSADTNAALATIAFTGREVDRPGMEAMTTRIAAELTQVP